MPHASPNPDSAPGKIPGTQEESIVMEPYVIRRAPTPPSLRGEWESTPWNYAEAGTIAHFTPRSSSHRPRVQFRLLYDPEWIYLIFRVEDRYVRCVHTGFNDPVCRDSCTEFFVEPPLNKGYLNFEINCGGAMLCYHIEDATRTPDGFAKYSPLTPEEGALVRIYHSIPEVVEPEITEEVTWVNEVHIPIRLFEGRFGPLGDLAGQEWRGNLYKCGDETSHPHWATWAPIEGGNFHQPRFFGPLRFE